MATCEGTLPTSSFQKDDTTRFERPIFTFIPNTGETTPGTASRWYHIYFTVRKIAKDSCISAIEKSKISLFGHFDAVNRFTVEADDDTKRLTKLIDKVLSDLESNRTDGGTIEVAVRWHEKRTYKRTLSPNLIKEAKPEGWLYVFHTYWLGNFIKRDDWPRLQELINFYSTKFDCSGDTDGFVDVSSWERFLQTEGYGLSVFRPRLYENYVDVQPKQAGQGAEEPDVRWLVAKTFLFRNGAHKDENGAPQDERPDFYFRLSRTGIIEVREESRFKDKSAEKFLEGLLRHRDPLSPDDEDEDDSKLHTKDLAKKFALLLLKRFNEGPGKELKIREAGTGIEVKRERQRYTVIMMSGLRSNGKWIKPEKLLDKQPNVIRNFLEGTMVHKSTSKGDFEPPEIPDEVIERSVINTSTWKNELCIFGSTRCLIFFEPKTLLEARGHVVNYEDYWKCIVRCVEHTVSVRTALLLMESYSKSRLEKVPKLVRKLVEYEERDLTDGRHEQSPAQVKSDLKEDLKKLTAGIADILSLLPSLREVSVAPSAFRSGHAVDKFDDLNQRVFRFPDVIRHVQQNIDELTNFLQFLKQRELTMIADERAKREYRQASFLAVMGLLLALLGAAYTAPIYLDAFHKVCEESSFVECFRQPKVYYYGIAFIVALLLVHIGGLILFRSVSAQTERQWRKIGTIAAIALVVLILIVLGLWIINGIVSWQSQEPAYSEMTSNPCSMSAAHVPRSCEYRRFR